MTRLAAVHEVDVFDVNLANLDGEVLELFLDARQQLVERFIECARAEVKAYGR